MAENHKRHYYREEDWITFYRERQDAGELIDHIWLVEAGYCETYHAARKLTSRHVKKGILIPNRTRWQSFRISHKVKNVTQRVAPERQQAHDTSLTTSSIPSMSVNNSQNCQSLQVLAPLASPKEHSVCDVTTKKRKPLSGAERTRRWRMRQNSRQACTCSKGSDICDYCYNTRFFPVTALDALHASTRHANLLLSPDRRYFAALDSMPSTPVLVHRTFFEFYSPYLEPSMFDNIPSRNKAYRDVLTLNGVRIHYEIYKGGLVVVKPSLSRTPLLPSQLRDFMLQVRDALPFYSPPTEEWRIATSDVHFDTPTEEPSKRHSTFYVNSVKFQCYNKTLKGGRRILRLEVQISPGCTLAEYPVVVEAARSRLLEVLGRI